MIELFSERQRHFRGEKPDIYQYNDIPQELRTAIIFIIHNSIDDIAKRVKGFSNDHYEVKKYREQYKEQEFYAPIYRILCEHGIFDLTNKKDKAKNDLSNFIQKEVSIEKTLDVIEICFKHIARFSFQESENAISKLNQRFKIHSIGYQFESSEIIRVDSEIIHNEAVKPVLLLLREKDYQGANQEFLNAHEHYRHGRYEECMVDSLKAFESTIKVICNKRGWITESKDTASKLIEVCFNNALIPSYLNEQLTSLKPLLKGIATIRNNNGGHGQGTNIRTVPEYLARYALNLTASNILFLIESEKLKP